MDQDKQVSGDFRTPEDGPAETEFPIATKQNRLTFETRESGPRERYKN